MTNHLANESSPYLRQHAENPVDWYPWGDEALQRARDEDMPILVSIGYSSCHWCHVMEHESFSDPDTAVYMNEHFVCIKVDREERPDVDAVYMEAIQAMAGHGGWPLTGFLAPDQVPFHMGTYFPHEPRGEMPSFMQVMSAVVDVWTTRRDEIESEAHKAIEALGASGRLKPGSALVKDSLLERARHSFERDADTLYGGFGSAPKFPQAPVIDLLLGLDDADARGLAETTLRAMARGGIHDQLGGGFARYSVDERWEVPHFEKMLYDNALLARVYLHGAQETGDREFERVCRTTLDWMLDELTGPDGAGGGFCSALDADSDSPDGPVEGWFYTWDYDEFRAICGQHADDMCAFFDVSERGDLDGRSVLKIGQTKRRPEDAVFNELSAALLAKRRERPAPFRDDKRVAAWNALAIAALADAGRVLREPRYIDAAVAAAEFVERELLDGDGTLHRTWLDAPGPDGFLEDYAHLTAALLTLYEATFDARWFALARQTADQTIDRFADPDGGFFTTESGPGDLIVRRKDVEDNPVPSGNATAAHALLRLHALTGDERYRDSAANTLQMLQPMMKRYPGGVPSALQAVQLFTRGVAEIALVGDPAEYLNVIDSRFRPCMVTAWQGAANPFGATERASADSSEPAQRETVPLLEGKSPADGKPTCYVCSGFVCQEPVTEAEALRQTLA